MEVKLIKSKSLKEKPIDESNLGFGLNFTDHMFLMDYDTGIGWHDPRIVPYGPLCLDPAAMVFHYGQEVFEGLKAYRTPEDKVVLFRPDENFKRLNKSNDRMCIPTFDEDLALEGLIKLVETDIDWVPHSEGTTLYIRPFIFATDPFIGVRPADKLIFCIILSPVGAYYKTGLNPVKISVETKYVRGVLGGTCEAKTGGNYAASLKSQDEAKKKNFSQVLWLDGIHRKYIEEVGTMNIMFKIDGKVVTPSLEGTILAGITRKSCIEILKDWGIPVEERKISIDEIYECYLNGTLEEAFGTGTAAVISPVGELQWDEKKIIISKDGSIGKLTQRLYDHLTGIQTGKVPDTKGWMKVVK